MLALLAAMTAVPGMAQAQTADALPKGYASDELPALPPSQGAASAPAAPPVETQAVTDDEEAEADEYADTDPSALTDFREPLSPYGTWVEDSTYGTVWVPAASVVGADFAPYQTNGRWEYTADGDWLWVSDYEWGHVPFHYGRWVWITGRGWSWIPGRVYAPAWVSWRTSDYGYIGWAPAPPTYYWSGGVAVGLWSYPSAAYVFCPTTYVFHRHVHTYVVRDHHIVRRIGAHSKPYKPANPSVGGGAQSGQAKKAPAGPGGSSAVVSPKSNEHRVRYPKGPSLMEAKVPSGVEPKMRGSHDSRALAFSTRSSTAKAKSLPPSARGLQGSPGRSSASPSGSAMPSRGRADGGSFESRSRPVLRTPRQSDGGFERAPSASPSPRQHIERSPAPSRSPQVIQQPAPSRVTPSAPSAPVKRRGSESSSQPSVRSAPSIAPTPAPMSRPSVRPSPSPSPSRSMQSAPSSRPSAPSPRRR